MGAKILKFELIQGGKLDIETDLEETRDENMELRDDINYKDREIEDLQETINERNEELEDLQNDCTIDKVKEVYKHFRDYDRYTYDEFIEKMNEVLSA